MYKYGIQLTRNSQKKDKQNIERYKNIEKYNIERYKNIGRFNKTYYCSTRTSAMYIVKVKCLIMLIEVSDKIFYF